MMLSSALMAMIDKAECLIFLNTKNSIKLIEGIANTESPWLYLEIGISQIIQKKIPERFLLEHEELSSKRQLFEKAQSIKYEVDLNHLTEIDHNTLNQWSVSKYLNSPQDALDALYTISPAKQYSDSLHGS